MPIWFREVEFNGDENNGTIIFHTHNKYDGSWGSNAKMEFSWEKKDRTHFYHPREVQSSIDQYNAINMVITKKEKSWLNSHEFEIWYGRRSKLVRKRYYPENAIHGIFYCDMTERLFNIHATIIRDHYDGFKSFILKSYSSLICH